MDQLNPLGRHFFAEDTYLEFLLYYLTLPVILQLRDVFPFIKDFDIWNNPYFLQRLGRLYIGRGGIFNPEKCKLSLNWSRFCHLEKLHRGGEIKKAFRHVTHNYSTECFLHAGGRSVTALCVLPSHAKSPYQHAILYCESKILRLYSSLDLELPDRLLLLSLPHNAIDFAVSPQGSWIAVCLENHRILFLNLENPQRVEVLWTDWFFQNESFSSHIFYDDQTIIQPTCDLMLVKRIIRPSELGGPPNQVYCSPLHQGNIPVQDRLKMLEYGNQSWHLAYKLVHFEERRHLFYLTSCGKHHHKHKMVWIQEEAEEMNYIVFSLGAVISFKPTPDGDKLFVLILTFRNQVEITASDATLVNATEFESCSREIPYSLCRHLVIYELDLKTKKLAPVFHLPRLGIDHPIIQNDVVLHFGHRTLSSFKKMDVTQDYVIVENRKQAFIFNHSILRTFHLPYVVDLGHTHDSLAVGDNLNMILSAKTFYGLDVKILGSPPDPFKFFFYNGTDATVRIQNKITMHVP